MGGDVLAGMVAAANDTAAGATLSIPTFRYTGTLAGTSFSLAVTIDPKSFASITSTSGASSLTFDASGTYGSDRVTGAVA